MPYEDYQADFNLSFFLFIITKMARTARASLCDFQNPQTPATGLEERARVDSYWLLCLHRYSCLRCWGKAYGIAVIPECALAATKHSLTSQLDVGDSPKDHHHLWGGRLTHSVSPRQTAHCVV